MLYPCLLSPCFLYPLASAWAIGLGELRVQSALGQNLRMEVQLLGEQGDDVLQVCVKGSVSNVDGNFLLKPGIRIGQERRGKTIILSSNQAVYEPALSVHIALECGMATERTWQVLLDLPAGTLNRGTELPRVDLTVANTDAVARTGSKRSRRAPPASSPISASIAASDSSNATRLPQQLPVPVAQAEPPAANGSVLPQTAAATPGVNPGANSGANPKPLPPARRNERGERSVLRLSRQPDAEIVAEMERLILQKSEGLSADSVARAEAASALRSVRMPALTPEMRAAQELSSMQQKIRMLESEAARLQRRSDEQDLQLAGKPVTGKQWLLGLVLLLLAALLAIAWLLWRMQQIQRQRQQQQWQAAVAMQEWDDVVQVTSAESMAPHAKAATSAPSAHSAAQTDTGQARQAASVLKPSNKARQASAPFTDDGKAAPGNAAYAVVTTDELLPDDMFEPHSNSVTAGGKPEVVNNVIEFERLPNLHERDLEMPTVAEVTDAMHEAEFWISLGKPEKAAEVLELYGKGEHGTSPVTWLYLFDLYRTLQQKEKYQQLLVQFHRRFNGKVPEWDEEPEPAPQHGHGLEHLPNLLEKISLLWGTSQMVPFLEELIVDNREGMRTGFALPTYREILFLLDLAYAVARNEHHHGLEFA